MPEGDPKRVREEQRADAVSREYRAKLDDLARQYATRVTVEWVQTLELVMPVHRLQVQIRRRKAHRTIALDWNPLARRLEPPACEATAGMERPRRWLAQGPGGGASDAAHEGYPGHHTERSTKEVVLVRERGALEETIGRASTDCSREQIGQFAIRRLWRQNVGTPPLILARRTA